MVWRKMAARFLIGVAMSGGAVLVVFVLAPWLTSLGAPLEPPDERVPQALGSIVQKGEGSVPEMPLREGVVEHPVMAMELGAARGKAAGPGTQAVAGKLPAVLSPAEVAAAMSEFVRVASAPDVEMDDGEGREGAAAVEAEPAGETPAGGGEQPDDASVPALPAPEAVEAEKPVAVEGDDLEASGGPQPAPVEAPADVVPGATETASPASVGNKPRGDAPAPSEVSEPADKLSGPEVHDAGQNDRPHADPPPQRAAETAKNIAVSHSLRGVMGYRLPLVSRQEVPDQVISGVLIPAHTTYVILRKGEWELVGLSPDEVERLRQAAAKPAVQSEAEDDDGSRRWRLFDLFRKDRRGAE